jgi:hypothetical protein
MSWRDDWSFVIVSRHEAAIEFAREALGLPDDVRVIRGNATKADVAGKTVIGNVPLALAASASQVLAIEFSGAPPRGAEYSVDDMRAAGARIVGYVVRSTGFEVS